MSYLKKSEVSGRQKAISFLHWNMIVFVLFLLLFCFRCSLSNQSKLAQLEPFPQDLKSHDPLEEVVYEEFEAEPIQEGSEVVFKISDEIQIPFNTEEYDYIKENNFKLAIREPLSTFSIDVDNASYSNLRRHLNYNQLPPKDAVRVEEMINYFSYNYPAPNKQSEHPFEVFTEIAACPWNDQNQLVHIGIQGQKLNYDELKPSNLVFLIDVSGSMENPNKLGLVKKSLNLLIDNLKDQDKVSLVVYAGAAGVVLPATSVKEKEKIVNAISRLKAGGSTAGGAGIRLAYDIAVQNLIDEGNNRVILATDGDFNIGVSSTSELVRLIEEKRQLGVYLTICGFGMGNYKDGRMEQISNAGNGNYFYIDNIREAEKVFVREMRANMFTIAKDVKIQVEFNPTKVKAYRLIGYENRLLANEDFEDDTKDAGELGAGHTVTALYEVVPGESKIQPETISRYVKNTTTEYANSNELMTLNLRYKPIKSETSKLIVSQIKEQNNSLTNTTDNFRFSAAVAGFGMLLRESDHHNGFSYDDVIHLASTSDIKDGDRSEFISMVRTAKLLSLK